MKNEIKGIGGWLYLWMISLIIIILLSVIIMFDSDSKGIFLFGLVLFGFYLWLAICFFCKMKVFVKVVRITLGFIIAFSIFQIISLIYAIISSDIIIDEKIKYLIYVIPSIIQLIVQIVWIQYFKKSERVKNTFIN